MYTQEPKLKKFVEKWNKRNRDINKRQKKEKEVKHNDASSSNIK